ncbi:hypothetical protein BCD67_10665 [Oscillatoriales cyanobacterium USR001]|nr:hypothetical protein BCD67_10665 [Oscillatoriales cyanobacterium USR001]
MTMTEAISAQAAALLIHYSFDISRDTVEQLLSEWLAIYPPYWLRLAVIEALYQGRYKTISVEHILAMWQRRGQPLYHFNHEFERLVCSSYPLDSTVETEPILAQNEIDLLDWEIPAASELPPRQSANLNQEIGEVKELESSQSYSEFSITNWTGKSAEISNQEQINEVKSEDSDSELETNEKLVSPIKHTDFYTKLKAVATEAKRKEGN